jgi:7,8-dihydroneopterin aldolase/epimerase/oxygenase
MDTIVLTDLKIRTKIGCNEAERATPQEMLLSVEFRHPTAHVATKDRLDEAVDYMEIVEMMEEIGKTERWTIERLAEDIAAAVLKRWKLDGGVRVTVKKHPPIPAKEVSVTIERP